MKKRIFCKVITMVLALCMLMSTTAFAATTYYIEVTLKGPDANGETQTISGSSSRYGALSSPLVYEVVQLLNVQLEAIKTVFAKTGLSQIVYDGLNAFKEGEAAWKAFGDRYVNEVTGESKDVLRSLDSTFGDLKVDKANIYSYTADNGNVYFVTITLHQHQSGMGGGGFVGDICVGGDDCAAKRFDDIDIDAWYHDGVCYCVRNGLMNGFPNDLFKPDENLTRAQVAQILYNREERPAVEGEKKFSDVEASAWYANAVEWAAEVGITNGYKDGTFKPDEPVTREQFAVMLYRYSEYKKYDVSVDENVDLQKFSDAEDISDWAVEAMEWAYAEGIIEGFASSTLEPDGYATRAQAATMLMRYCLNVAK